MKIRSDFVSNSSSSSVILAQNILFDYFKITKQDIIDALKALSTSGFEVFDLTIKSEKEDAIKKYGDILSWFNSKFSTLDSNGELESISQSKCNTKRYEDIMWNLKSIFDISNIESIFNPENKDDKPYMWNYQKRKEEPVPKCIIETLILLRKKCGILTNLEALKLPCSGLFIHFGENDIFTIDGFSKYGKPDIKYVKTINSTTDKYDKQLLSDYDKQIVSDIETYKFETEHSSLDRLLEILIKQLVSMGKIKPNDEDFLTNYDKSLNYENKKSDGSHHTASGNSYTYEDLYQDVLAFCGHEG